jgi:hypothetical protein
VPRKDTKLPKLNAMKSSVVLNASVDTTSNRTRPSMSPGNMGRIPSEVVTVSTNNKEPQVAFGSQAQRKNIFEPEKEFGAASGKEKRKNNKALPVIVAPCVNF